MNVVDAWSRREHNDPNKKDIRSARWVSIRPSSYFLPTPQCITFAYGFCCDLDSLPFSALKNVPLVKLDAVDDVMKMFTEAIDLMETHQMIVDEDERATQLQTSAGSSQSALLALANPSTASTSNSSASSSDNESDSFRQNGAAHLVNKSVTGLASAAMTVDYSSPSSKTRSLGGKAAAPKAAPVLGLGLKSAAGGEKKPAVLGLGHGATHKPSSRATTGTSALATGASSPVSPTTPDSSNDEAPTQAAAPVQLKNKLLGNVAPTNREFPSPKLGPRSLGGAPKAAAPAQATPVVPAASANPAAAGLALPAADALGRDVPAATTAGAASPDADDEGDAEPDETEVGDLILTDKKNSVFNRVKSTLPVTASPKQIRSSFHLLELATTAGIAPEDDDLTLKGQTATTNGGSGAPSDRSVGVLSALPTGIQSDSKNSTPKPSYLRRLDSPDTHHGQLLAAKARLQLLLNKGIQLADRVNLAMVPEIKAKLEKALAKLEASLVQATIGPQ